MGAEDIDKTLGEASFSKAGKRIFYPHDGIIAQVEQARGCKFNATAGTAINQGEHMTLPSMLHSKLSADETVGYASSFGDRVLRNLWQKEMWEKNPSLTKEISLPLVTASLTHGLSIVGLLFGEMGSKIVISDSYWGNYDLIFDKVYGVGLEKFPLFFNNEFNVAGMKQAILGQERKIVLLNFPHNPSGYSPDNKCAQKIIDCLLEVAQKDKITVVLDDAYFGLTYKEGLRTESLFAALANAHENLLAIKIDGATKEEFAWGLRIGFLTFGCKGFSKEQYSALEDKTAGAVRATVSNCSQMAQKLIIKTMQSNTYREEKQKNFETLKKRFEIASLEVSRPKYQEYMQALPHNSGYFLCVRVAEPEKVRLLLLEKYSTGVIRSGELLRVAFSGLEVEQIPQVFENIYLACQDLAKNT